MEEFLAAGEATQQQGSLLGMYASTFLLTISNPLTILSFSAVFAALGLGTTPSTILAGTMMVLGVFLGSALWWLVLSVIAGVAADRLGPRVLFFVHKLSGGVVLLFGLAALVSGALPPSP